MCGQRRAAHKAGFFEVIAGRSVVAFRRVAEDEVAEAKCFGYVQTYDQRPRRRLWDLLKPQGLQDHQQVVFMSDGGDDVRRVQAHLHPGSEHWIDWFHITMRLTVLQQQTKSLQAEAGRADLGKEISTGLDSVKHLLWHGNAVEAQERQAALLLDLDLIRAHSPAAEKLTVGMSDFNSYIRNNRTSIPNSGERYRLEEEPGAVQCDPGRPLLARRRVGRDGAGRARRQCLDMGERTCFLHAFCWTELKTKISLRPPIPKTVE